MGRHDGRRSNVRTATGVTKRWRWARGASALFVLAWLVSAASSGCQVKSDDLFCCSSPASCGDDVEPGTTVQCEDPVRSVCDDTGQYGIARTCVEDPMKTPCDVPADCTNPDRPVCLDHTCVECADSGGCTDAVPVCTPTTHLCNACQEDMDCDGRVLGRCLTATGACVGCLDATDCTSATAPVCDDTGHTCRACRADSECASNLCEEDAGACVSADDIIYVAASGGTTGTCTQAAPCQTIALGVAQVTPTRKIIRVAPGTYVGKIVLQNNIEVRIVAPGAVARPASSESTVVEISRGADVTIEGLTMTGTGGAGDPVGVDCQPNGGAPPSVRLLGTVITTNRGGGVSINNCQFSLLNNLIIANGAAGQSTPAVSIERISATTGTLREFAFNTITTNVAAAGIFTGVTCGSQVIVPIAFNSNIVYDNFVSGPGAAQVGGDADCVWSYSDIGPQALAGTGNIATDPMFADPATSNFHLMSSSPAKNAADPAAMLPKRDIDGDLRGQGGRSDMGCDEVVE